MIPVTLAEFARIKGVSPPAVKKAIENGRLVNSLVYGLGKKPKLDPVIAAQEWEKNTDHSKRTVGADIRPQRTAVPFEKADVPKGDEPPNSSGSTFNTSRSVREAYLARMAKLNYEEKLGKLVDAEQVKASGFKLGRTIRDNLLNIPNRLSSELAGITDPAKIHMLLTQEITKSLEVLSRDE